MPARAALRKTNNWESPIGFFTQEGFLGSCQAMSNMFVYIVIHIWRERQRESERDREFWRSPDVDTETNTVDL